VDQITDKKMSELWDSSAFYGESTAWLESLYETYLQNPDSLDAKWRQYFDALPSQKDSAAAGINGNDSKPRYDTNGINGNEVSPQAMHDYFINYAQRKKSRGFEVEKSFDHERKQVHVLQLINAYRFRGHQIANINPLGGRRDPEVVELELDYYDFTEDDLDLEFETGSLAAADCLTLREIVYIVQQTYCGNIGTEYMHILVTAEKRWIQQRLETARGFANLNEVEKINILQQLTDAEGLERYLHSKYVGQKRFSLEGGESLIPLLDELVQYGGSQLKKLLSEWRIAAV